MTPISIEKDHKPYAQRVEQLKHYADMVVQMIHFHEDLNMSFREIAKVMKGSYALWHSIYKANREDPDIRMMLNNKYHTKSK